jgi:hypothetical protein
MSSDWKYILFDMPIGGYTIFLFPPVLSHADVADRFRGSEPVSAGFVRLDEFGKELICYGKSDSLKLVSKPGDAIYANYLLHPPGERI